MGWRHFYAPGPSPRVAGEVGRIGAEKNVQLMRQVLDLIPEVRRGPSGMDYELFMKIVSFKSFFKMI